MVEFLADMIHNPTLTDRLARRYAPGANRPPLDVSLLHRRT